MEAEHGGEMRVMGVMRSERDLQGLCTGCKMMELSGKRE